ncbi:MAG: hypothetical protein HYW48_05200 [Deltaproteobacteria bacterium]|nr:hypothetical protein [Deltaproteobacteria bacterium]
MLKLRGKIGDDQLSVKPLQRQGGGLQEWQGGGLEETAQLVPPRSPCVKPPPCRRRNKTV